MTSVLNGHENARHPPEQGEKVGPGLLPGAVLRPLGLLIAVVLLGVLSAGAVPPDSMAIASPSSLVERERYGFVATRPNWHNEFDVSQLKAGWFVAGARPTCGVAPEGMEQAQLLHVSSGYTVNPDWLGPSVDNRPGDIWLVGNEPDRRYFQGDVEPVEYARIYHDVYTFIKDRRRAGYRPAASSSRRPCASSTWTWFWPPIRPSTARLCLWTCGISTMPSSTR